MPAHAFLSASGADRWLNCTPSVKLEQDIPEEKSSYAEEGTFAHTLAELYLKFHLKQIKNPWYEKQLKELKTNPFYCQEMDDHVQVYLAFAIDRINAAYNKSKDAVILLEQRTNFSPWVPGGFGTGDLIIIADKLLEIIDFKYGKGVPVSAENNSQMRLYGLGALNQFDILYDIEKIAMTIMQPRLDSISTEELIAKQLLAWGNEFVKPRAELAYKGEGNFVAGDHCRFCRAKAICRARAEKNLELAKYDFQAPPLLSQAEITDILFKADALKSWAADVQTYALDQAEKHGVKFLGWKLVEGRSNRKYADEKAVAQTLIIAGYKEEDLYTKVLNGITIMEKFIGKKKFSTLLKDLVIKPDGKPTLTPESDKRPEINSTASAIVDFREDV